MALENKLGLTSSADLARAEERISKKKALELFENGMLDKLEAGKFSALMEIHKYLFEDLYDWAGIVRIVDISKKGTNFTSAENIVPIAEACFGRLKELNYFKGFSFDEFIENITDFYCATNILHPFREGNGRTQRIFIAQLIRFCGYDINFSEIETDELMIATIHSANGITDYLKDIFRKNIKKNEP